MTKRLFLFLGLLAAVCLQAAPAPTRVPAPAPPLPPGERAVLQNGLLALGREIDGLKVSLKNERGLLEYLPDVQIYYNAVQTAMAQELFYQTNRQRNDFLVASNLLQEGLVRVRELQKRQVPWISQTGLVVRGYVSRLDGSVQPYGLVVPPTYKLGEKTRLDLWFHGRDEKLSELKFINDRRSNGGIFTPANTIVLHPYGRYCNASRFGGEIDALEALDSVRKDYSIDEDRIVIRGFSMGGGSAWHIGTHFAARWAAVNPGAGFVDTKNFLRLNDKMDTIPWYQQKLWHIYDSMDYAANLANTTVIAYSGEIDGQKQAADLMVEATKAEGVPMTHIIGPKTGHAYEPGAKTNVAKLVDAAAAKGRNPVLPKIRFVTYTLRYNQMGWVTIDSLDQHWARAEVNAELTSDGLKATTTNVTAITFSMPVTAMNAAQPRVTLDGQGQFVDGDRSNGKWTVHLRKDGAKWVQVKSGDPALHKSHGLQGPIDDAFMDSFLVVRPTGKAANDAVSAWTRAEAVYASEQWWRQFRGMPRMKDDTAVTEEDIANHNLILFGDAASNKLIARILPKLPITWNDKTVQIGQVGFPADKYVPVLVYPNPLNPKHYVVLNSGFTFSETGVRNNAMQVPTLPDWALVDVTVPRAERIPSAVVSAGFFDEHWQVKTGGQ